jgi:hypothetical protein
MKKKQKVTLPYQQLLKLLYGSLCCEQPEHSTRKLYRARAF